MILCPVGDQMRLVDHDLFIEIHEQLAAHYRQLGLTDHRLDLAIETHLPCRLEQILDGSTVHRPMLRWLYRHTTPQCSC